MSDFALPETRYALRPTHRIQMQGGISDGFEGRTNGLYPDRPSFTVHQAPPSCQCLWEDSVGPVWRERGLGVEGRSRRVHPWSTFTGHPDDVH